MAQKLTVIHEKQVITELRNKAIFAMLLLLSMNLVSVYVYEKLEKWDFVDALYFSTATMTTVGYGDIVPTTSEGRLFTVVYIWFSVGFAFYFLTTLFPPLVKYMESRFENSYLKRKRV